MEGTNSNPSSDDELHLIDSDDEVKWKKDISKLKEFKAGIDEPTVIELTDIQDPSILNVILSCSELTSNADNVLIINRAMIYLLRTMRSQIMARLRSNVSEQEYLYETLKKLDRKSKTTVFHASSLKCGMPYFKLPNGWAQPKNLYWDQHKKLGYATPEMFHKSCYCWTTKENNELRELVIASVRETKLIELETKVRHLSRYGGVDDLLATTSKQIKKLKKGDDIEIDPNEVDWLRVSKNLKSVFSPSECQSQWTFWVDPALNSSKWTAEEQKKLCTLVKENGFQSWDKIARLLDTGRNALKCCIVFHQNIAKNYDSTIDNEKFLLLFNYYKNKPRYLVKISFFAGCSLNECSKRLIAMNLKSKVKPERSRDLSEMFKDDLKFAFEHTPSQKRSRLVLKHKQLRSRCTFSSEEDYLLLEAVTNHGKDWSIVYEAVPGRTESQVKERYEQLISFSKSVLKTIGKSESREQFDLLPSGQSNRPGHNVWSILQLFWEPTNDVVNSILGVPLNKEMSTSTQQLLKIFEFGHRNLFGPRLPSLRTDEQKQKMVLMLSVISQALNLKFEPRTAAELIEKHAKSVAKPVGYPESMILKLSDCESNFIYTPNILRSLVPPNLLTLLGTRVMLSVRGLLYSQAELQLPISFTQMNPSINVEDRLKENEAKERLKSRIFSIFFLSMSLAKISRYPGPNLFNQICKSTPKRKKKMSKLKMKKRAKKLCAQRWKKTIASPTKKEKKKRLNTSPVPQPAKKAKMVRVTKVGNTAVVVPMN